MQNVEFNIQPSRIYRSFLSIATVGCGAVILAINISMIARLGIISVLFIYMAIVFWRDALLRGKQAVTYLRKTAGLCWLLQTKQDTCLATLMGDSIITRWVCVLRFQLEDSTEIRQFVLFPDSFPNKDYRAFIVSLRLGV